MADGAGGRERDVALAVLPARGHPAPRNPGDTIGLGAPYPQYLANSVLETYDQGHIGRASSCLECHHRATIPGDSATGGAKFSDYSFLFMLAQGEGR